MSENDEKGIAQPKDTMFVRNVAHAASRGKEVTIKTKLGDEVTGFVAGLDEEFIQICDTADQSLEIISRANGNISSFKETGKTLTSYTREGFEPEKLKRIRDRVEHYSKKMSFQLSNKKVR